MTKELIHVRFKTNAGNSCFSEEANVQAHPNKTDITKAVKSLIDKFNKEEERRKMTFPNYPKAAKRSLKEIISFKTSELIPAHWEKLAGYHNKSVIYYCKNTGIIERGEWFPNIKFINKHICNTCNQHFEAKEDFDSHFEEVAHWYCERNSQDIYPFFSDSLESLLEEQAESLRNELHDMEIVTHQDLGDLKI